MPHFSTAVAVHGRRAEHHPPADWHGVSLSLPVSLGYIIHIQVIVSKLAPHLRGLWVALAGDQETVLASGKTAEEAFQKAQKTRPETLIITHLAERDETPNDDLLESIRLGEAELKQGTLTYYDTADEFLASLD